MRGNEEAGYAIGRHKEEGTTQCEARLTISTELRVTRDVRKAREKPQHRKQGHVDQDHALIDVYKTIHSLSKLFFLIAQRRYPRACKSTSFFASA